MKKWFFLVAGVMLLVCIPQAAQAAPGYMTCQGFQADNRRVIYTRAFAAESTSADAMYEQFLKS